jgi:hypothetical protein
MAYQVIDAERWNDPALGWSLDEKGLRPIAQAIRHFTLGFAALNRGDRATASAAVERMKTIESGTGLASTPSLLAQELQAAVLRAEGQEADAERLLTEVAKASRELPVDYGPPVFVKPPYELLGEWLLADGRKVEARQAFTEALALMPGRLLSLRGLSQSGGGENAPR